MKPTMLKINELRIEDEKYVMKSCLINPAHIVSVQSGKLAKKGVHIIGHERERELRMITLRTGPPVFVDETVEEIERRLTAGWQPVKVGDGVSVSR